MRVSYYGNKVSNQFQSSLITLIKIIRKNESDLITLFTLNTAYLFTH